MGGPPQALTRTHYHMTTEQLKKPSRRYSAELLELHKVRMKDAGFRRMSAWVSNALRDKLAQERRQGECTGRTLERLLLGEAATRPPFGDGSTEREPAPTQPRST